MNGQGSGESALESGDKHFGESEEERCVDNDRGKKRIKQTPIDQFDELPDSLIIHILSFLNVKEAAITCVLSKRWEFLWADLPRLEFRDGLSRVDLDDGSGAIEKVRNFVSWVNRTLAVRRVNNLEKFDVSFFHYRCFSSDVDAWVQFAVKSKVKKLNLHVFSLDDIYKPPEVMYSCPSLTTLYLTGCHMDFKRTIQWQSLTVLYLHIVLMDQLLLDQILSTCPVLHILILEMCRGFDRLEISSPSLHSVSIVDSVYDNAHSPPLKISAPYIRSLEISLPLVGRKLQVENISSLVRAHIDYHEFSWNSIALEVMSAARELLESVQHVKDLYVGSQFIKVASMIAVTGRQLPQSRRELLIVASESEYENSTFGILSLLESSPNLETLVIEGRTAEEEGVILPIDEEDLADDLLHLKTIKVTNFADSKGEPMLTLARILLKRATALEEMVITTDVKDLSDFAEVVQEMLTYPRSSTKAIVRLVNSSAIPSS